MAIFTGRRDVHARRLAADPALRLAGRARHLPRRDRRDRRWELPVSAVVAVRLPGLSPLGTVAADILNDLIHGKGDIYESTVTRIA